MACSLDIIMDKLAEYFGGKEACKKYGSKSDKNSSSTNTATNDTTPTVADNPPAVANNHGLGTAYFHDEDELYTDELEREAIEREAVAREAMDREANKEEGTAPIKIVRPQVRPTADDKNLYSFWIRGPQRPLKIRGPGQLKSDQYEKEVSHKKILQKSRERYERLMAKQGELPEEERLIDWRKKLSHTADVW
ncbi:MAG: hypothetical protein Q9203_007713 [Teloschistes exilis]